MPEHEVTLHDIEDIRVRALQGTVEKIWQPRYLRLSTRFTTTTDEEDLSTIVVDMELSVYGSDNRELSDSSLTYTSSVSAIVNLSEKIAVSDDETFGRNVISAVWPYLRAPITSHAKALGAPPIALPISADFPLENAE